MLEKIGRKLLGLKPHTFNRFHDQRDFSRRFRYWVRKPSWVHCPENIQIDTHNYCNLWMGEGTGCIHCNVKPMKSPEDKKRDWKLPRGRMPSEMIKYIIEYWSKHGAKTIAPYINGEPMLDGRLPWICDVSRENKMRVVVDTNATLFDRRKQLIHPSLAEVRMTVSAVTSETYKIVHGKDLFREANATVNWVLKNRLPNQYPLVYFITNEYNKSEIFDYIKKWKNKLHIVIFPLHEVTGIQKASDKARPKEVDYWGDLTKKITGSYPKQAYSPIDIYPDGSRRTRYFCHYVACQGSHSFSVSWNGLLLHCTDIPYKYNYGHIYDNDMLEVWHKRNLAKIDHPACSVCNVRNPRHDEILRRYLT